MALILAAKKSLKSTVKSLIRRRKFMAEDAYKEIKKQIDKLSRMHPDSADANTLQSYLDWVLEIPFENIAKKKVLYR